METLREYLERVMRHKRLTPKELAKRCKVTNSYIGRILKGKYGNLSVKTIVALSEGLGVNAHEVFTAASGVPTDEAMHIDPHLLLAQIQKLIHNPIGYDVLKQWLRLSSEKQKTVLELIDFLNEQQLKRQGRTRKK